jgi:hypothetical protein
VNVDGVDLDNLVAHLAEAVRGAGVLEEDLEKIVGTMKERKHTENLLVANVCRRQIFMVCTYE